MADLKISELAALAGADLVSGDLAAVVDNSASETKKITVSDLIAYGVTVISDDTIPGAKILFGSAEIAGSALENGAVDTTQLADDAVTAAKIADEATVDLVTTLPASGAFTGQIALDTDDNKIYIWDGSAWQSVKGAGSVNTVVGSTAGIVNIAITTSGDQVTITPSLDNTASGGHFLGGPTGAGGSVAYRAIVGSDLPTATTSTKGGVAVNGNGLTLSGDEIQIDNTVSANTTEYHLTQYDANGLITAGRQITATDMPEAGASTKGAVYPGSGLTVVSGGQLNHSNSATPGTYTKVTVDAQGHINSATNIAAADIPNIDASKIASGEFPTGRISDNAITGAKLSDYSTAKIADAAPIAEYVGQLFFNPLDRTLFMWDGNVFQPIGVSYGQVVFAGTYDADTNLITSITPDGAAIGLAVGSALVSPVAANRAHYVVVDQPGTGIAPAPTVSLSPPDILLSTGSDWVLLDVSDTVTAQLASNIQVTPAGDIASSNVQAALQELDTEKLALTGGTLTGDLNLGVAVDIVFEGANANANETTLTVVDPTADRTITLPDTTGTVALTSQLDDGTF